MRRNIRDSSPAVSSRESPLQIPAVKSVPGCAVLDEPFSALDAKIRQQMREELKRIQSELGITVIFVTHDQEEAMAISHRIVVMNKGKFDQVGHAR